jgi:hypothetical protein
MQQFSQVEHVERSILLSNDLPNFTLHRISNCTTTRIYLWRMRPDWPRPVSTGRLQSFSSGTDWSSTG